MGSELTQTELKQWWKDSATKWLADPGAEAGLLLSASNGLRMAEPELSRQCLVECRRRRAKTWKAEAVRRGK